MSAPIESGFLFVSGFVNLVIRALYLPLSILAWLWQIIGLNLKGVAALVGVGFIGWLLTSYGVTFIVETEYAMHCEVNPYYDNNVYPILNGIIGTFFNRLVCWYDAIIWMPYGVGRNVIFPILRDGGFAASMQNLAKFFSSVGNSLFLNYFFKTTWIYGFPNYTYVEGNWTNFITSWQGLWCYGCESLCPYYTNLPIIPSIFLTSNQFKDPQFMCAVEKTANGWFSAWSEIIYALRTVVWPDPGQGIFVPSFNTTTEQWLEAGTCWWTSWENALQLTWDTWIPIPFVWKDMLCIIDKIQAAMLIWWHTVWLAISNPTGILDHFRGINSTFYNSVIKYNFKWLLNILGVPAGFAPISVALPPNPSGGLAFTNITNYRYSQWDQSTPEGWFNPVYNQSNAADCLCVILTRILCDPQNNGTTCRQTFNGTLLQDVDPCCFGYEAFAGIANTMSFLFEFTLHVYSVNDFVMYIDQQPFTTYIADNINGALSCIYQVFLAVDVYGACIRNSLAGITEFIVDTAEVAFRTLLALITLPYFDAFIPGYANFITNSTRLSSELGYLDRLANASDPHGLINCLCFILNTGFNVPFAGCHNITCVPQGFLPITGKRAARCGDWQSSTEFNGCRQNSAEFHRCRENEKRSTGTFFVTDIFSDSFYNLTTRTGLFSDKLTPILTYGKQRRNSVNYPSLDQIYSTKDAFFLVSTRLDEKVSRIVDTSRCSARFSPSPFCPAARAMAEKLVPLNTSKIPINCTDPNDYTPNPMPCFDLCCLPKKLIQTSLTGVGTIFRGLNAAFATKFSVNGSSYWDGTACTQGQPCLQSDLTQFILQLFSIVDCICNFILLVLPPQGYLDPCCLFTLLGEIFSCLIQIIINVGNSIAGDGPNYTYIREPEFLSKDFDIVLDLVLAAFDCACNFVKVIFNIALSGFDIQYAFDPCCIVRVYFNAILKGVGLLLRLTIALTSLDTPSGQCFLYVNNYGNARPQCPYAITDLNFTKGVREILEILFAPPVDPIALTYCSVNVNLDMYNPDTQGLPTCICRTINALLAMVYKTIGYTGNLSAPSQCVINLCCPLFRIGQIIKESLDFTFQVALTLIQNWSFQTTVTGGKTENFFVPMETMNFFFCDEYGSAPYLPDGTPNPVYYNLGPNYQPIQANAPYNSISFNPNTSAINGIVNPNFVAQAKCGKLEPVLQSLQNLVNNCLCTQQQNGIFNILDQMMRWLTSYSTGLSTLFPKGLLWANCFCTGGSDGQGFIRYLGDVIVVALRSLISLARNIANPTYFTSQGGTITDPNFVSSGLTDNYQDIYKTWTARFLGPFLDSFCKFFTNVWCILSLILGDTCTSQRYMTASSVSAYVGGFIVRILSAFEGVAKLFTQEPSGLCVGQGSVGNANRPSDQGSNGQQNILVPTCSPTGRPGAMIVAGQDAGQLGRILNSLLMYIFDATIGVAKLGCSTICPGYRIDQNLQLVCTRFQQCSWINVYDPLANFTENQVEQQANICKCWNDSPFATNMLTTIPGWACSYEVCAAGYNSGLPNFTCMTTPPEQTGPHDPLADYYNSINDGTFLTSQLLKPILPNSFSCGPKNASYPPNTGVAVNASMQNLFDNGYCNLGCFDGSVRPDIVTPGSRKYYPASAQSWMSLVGPICGFTPMPSTASSSGVACQINPACNSQTIADLANLVLTPTLPILTNWTGAPVTLASCLNPVGSTSTFRPPFAGSCYYYQTYCLTYYMTGSTSDVLVQTNCNPYRGNAFYPAYTPITVYGSIPVLDACNQCQQIAINGTYYWGFEPPTKQKPCDRSFCAGLGLCKNDQMLPCYQGGPILDGMFIALGKYAQCLIISLYGNFPANVLQTLLNVLSLLWQISGGIVRLISYFILLVLQILSQIISGDFFSIVGAFVGGFIGLIGYFFNIFQGPYALIFRTVPLQQPYMCIMENDPLLCFSQIFRVDLMENTSAMDFLINRFGGNSACDLLFRNIADGVPWISQSFEKRYLVSECVSNRVAGEYWSKQTKGIIPDDIFYNREATFQAFINIKDAFFGTYFKKKREREKREPYNFDRHFEKHFKIPRDHYARMILSRSEILKRYFKNTLKIDENSPVFWPLMHIDATVYKYKTGYYGFLWNDMSVENYLKNTETADELFAEVKRGAREVFNPIWASVSFYPEQIIQAIIPDPEETPQFLRYVYSLKWLPRVSLDSLKIRFNPPKLSNVSILPTNVNWTPNIQRNWDLGKSFVYSLLHSVAPHYTTKEVHDRFILGRNCRIYDGTVDLGIGVFDYCVNDFVANLNVSSRSVETFSTRDEDQTLFDKYDLRSYLSKTSHLRRGSFFQTFRGKFSWVEKRGYRRPKPNQIPQTSPNVVRIHRNVYARAMISTNPGGFVGWLIDLINRIFNIDLIQDINNWINEFIRFMQNPNTDIRVEDWGAKYWFIKFPTTCDFPLNLNCYYGIGLGQALWKVGLVFIIVLAVLALFIPGVFSLATVFITLILYALVVSAVAWHYSPACALPFPSIQLTNGVTMPVLPIPLSIFPMLPMCLWDEALEVLSSIFATCYYWIPQTLINNASPCRACPERLSMTECPYLGMNTPLAELTFWGWKIFGTTFCDIMRGITSTVFVSWIPGVSANIQQVCQNLKQAQTSADIYDRMLLCAGLGFPFWTWLGLGGFILGTFIVAVLGAIINLFHAILLLLPSLPFWRTLSSGGGEDEMSVPADSEQSEESAAKTAIEEK